MDTKIKSIEQDPDNRWITICNDYLGRIKYFIRWLQIYNEKRFDDVQISDWQTPDFVDIKKKKLKGKNVFGRTYIRYKTNLENGITAQEWTEYLSGTRFLVQHLQILGAANFLFPFSLS